MFSCSKKECFEELKKTFFRWECAKQRIAFHWTTPWNEFRRCPLWLISLLYAIPWNKRNQKDIFCQNMFRVSASFWTGNTVDLAVSSAGLAVGIDVSPLVCPFPKGVHYRASPDDCSMFVQCTATSLVWSRCGPGLLFDETQQTCVFSAQASCSQLSTATTQSAGILPNFVFIFVLWLFTFAKEEDSASLIHWECATGTMGSSAQHNRKPSWEISRFVSLFPWSKQFHFLFFLSFRTLCEDTAHFEANGHSHGSKQQYLQWNDSSTQLCLDWMDLRGGMFHQTDHNFAHILFFLMKWWAACLFQEQWFGVERQVLFSLCHQVGMSWGKS